MTIVYELEKKKWQSFLEFSTNLTITLLSLC